MGKWAKLKDSLQRFMPEPTFQEQILTAKKSWKALKPNELGEALKAQKIRKMQLEDEVKDTNVQIEALSEMLIEWMNLQEIDSFRLATGGVITNVVTPYPTVVDEDKLLAWLGQEEPTERLKLPWPTLARIVRERLEQGHPLPEGVDVFYKEAAQVYGGKNG